MTTDTKELRALFSDSLVNALNRQQQLDADGVRVGVSRQAVCEAQAILSAIPALLDRLEQAEARCARLANALADIERAGYEAQHDKAYPLARMANAALNAAGGGA